MHGVVYRFIVGLAQLLRVLPQPVKAVRPYFALGLASCLKNEGFLGNYRSKKTAPKGGFLCGLED